MTGTQSYLLERRYFRGGQLKSNKTTDPIFGVVEDRVINEIDALGRVLSSTINGDAVSRTDTITHGVRQRATTGPRQIITEKWDAAGYPTHFANAILNVAMTPDASGNVERALRTEDGTAYAEIHTYDELDHRLTSEDNLGPVAEYVPRLDGKTTRVRDARGNTTVMEHSALGELVRRKRSDGMEFRFRHDEQRHLSFAGDSNKGFEYDYDNLFRLTRRTQRNGAEISNNSFDPRNQPTSITTPGGRATVSYDLLTRPRTSRVEFGGIIHSFSSEYDALNRVRVLDYEQTGDGTARATYSYDKAGVLMNARFEEAGPISPWDMGTGMTLMRNRITYPSGFVVNEERDNAGRLVRIFGQSEDIVKITAWQDSRQPKTMDFGGVLRADSIYDVRGRLTGSRYVRTPGSALQAELRYQYDGGKQHRDSTVYSSRRQGG